jgi:putative oxidoreductase
MSTALDQRTGPYAALLLRVILGVLFIAHLYWKFFVLEGGIARWWGDFATNGYPWFVPYYVISAELVGALCLIPGLYARWAALYAVPMMLGAAHFWSLRNGFYFAAAGSELPVVWSVMLIVQALLGDGIWAARPSTFRLRRAWRVTDIPSTHRGFRNP